LVKAKELAENLANHDYLTGLPNRNLLNETIRTAIARAKRNGEGFALISIDID
jgi:diguanylate cyclase (GGDEF)-like protein